MRTTIVILTAAILTTSAWGQTTQPAPAPATQPTTKVPAGDGNAGTEAYREFVKVAWWASKMTPEQLAVHKGHVDAFLSRLPSKAAFTFGVKEVFPHPYDANWRTVRLEEFYTFTNRRATGVLGPGRLVLAASDFPEDLVPNSIITLEGTPEFRENRSHATDANEEARIRKGANFMLGLGAWRCIVFQDCVWSLGEKTGSPLPSPPPGMKAPVHPGAIQWRRGQPTK